MTKYNVTTYMCNSIMELMMDRSKYTYGLAGTYNGAGLGIQLSSRTLQFVFQSDHKNRNMNIHYSVSEYNATYNLDAHIPRTPNAFSAA